MQRKKNELLLTHWISLPVQVVKEFGVAGKHAATRWTGYEPLLSVATHVFPQTIPDLEESITACNRHIKTLYLKEERACLKCVCSVIPLHWQKRACCCCARDCCSALST